MFHITAWTEKRTTTQGASVQAVIQLRMYVVVLQTHIALHYNIHTRITTILCSKICFLFYM